MQATTPPVVVCLHDCHGTLLPISADSGLLNCQSVTEVTKYLTLHVFPLDIVCYKLLLLRRTRIGDFPAATATVSAAKLPLTGSPNERESKLQLSSLPYRGGGPTAALGSPDSGVCAGLSISSILPLSERSLIELEPLQSWPPQCVFDRPVAATAGAAAAGPSLDPAAPRVVHIYALSSFSAKHVELNRVILRAPGSLCSTPYQSLRVAMALGRGPEKVVPTSSMTSGDNLTTSLVSWEVQQGNANAHSEASPWNRNTSASVASTSTSAVISAVAAAATAASASTVSNVTSVGGLRKVGSSTRAGAVGSPLHPTKSEATFTSATPSVAWQTVPAGRSQPPSKTALRQPLPQQPPRSLPDVTTMVSLTHGLTQDSRDSMSEFFPSSREVSSLSFTSVAMSTATTGHTAVESESRPGTVGSCFPPAVAAVTLAGVASPAEGPALIPSNRGVMLAVSHTTPSAVAATADNTSISATAVAGGMRRWEVGTTIGPVAQELRDCPLGLSTTANMVPAVSGCNAPLSGSSGNTGARSGEFPAGVGFFVEAQSSGRSRYSRTSDANCDAQRASSGRAGQPSGNLASASSATHSLSLNSSTLAFSAHSATRRSDTNRTATDASGELVVEPSHAASPAAAQLTPSSSMGGVRGPLGGPGMVHRGSADIPPAPSTSMAAAVTSAPPAEIRSGSVSGNPIGMDVGGLAGTSPIRRTRWQASQSGSFSTPGQSMSPSHAAMQARGRMGIATAGPSATSPSHPSSSHPQQQAPPPPLQHGGLLWRNPVPPLAKSTLSLALALHINDSASLVRLLTHYASYERELIEESLLRYHPLFETEAARAFMAAPGAIAGGSASLPPPSLSLPTSDTRGAYTYLPELFRRYFSYLRVAADHRRGNVRTVLQDTAALTTTLLRTTERVRVDALSPPQAAIAAVEAVMEADNDEDRGEGDPIEEEALFTPANSTPTSATARDRASPRLPAFISTDATCGAVRRDRRLDKGNMPQLLSQTQAQTSLVQPTGECNHPLTLPELRGFLTLTQDLAARVQAMPLSELDRSRRAQVWHLQQRYDKLVMAMTDSAQLQQPQAYVAPLSMDMALRLLRGASDNVFVAEEALPFLAWTAVKEAVSAGAATAGSAPVAGIMGHVTRRAGQRVNRMTGAGGESDEGETLEGGEDAEADEHTVNTRDRARRQPTAAPGDVNRDELSALSPAPAELLFSEKPSAASRLALQEIDKAVAATNWMVPIEDVVRKRNARVESVLMIITAVRANPNAIVNLWYNCEGDSMQALKAVVQAVSGGARRA